MPKVLRPVNPRVAIVRLQVGAQPISGRIAPDTIALVSSAFAPMGELAGWMQPIARANPVTAAVGLVRSLASGGPAAFPLLELACWSAGLLLVPGILAVRRWQAPS